MQQRARIKAVHILFGMLLALSGYGKFTNEFFAGDAKFPFPLNIFIDENRTLVFFCVLSLTVLLGGKVILKAKNYALYFPVIIFHFFLSAKLFALGNPEWYINLVGAIFLVLLVGIVTKVAISMPNFQSIEKIFIFVILSWLFSIALIYFFGGWDGVQHNGRFFYFSAHPNHAGLLWAFSAVTCFFLFLRGTITPRILSACLMCTSMYLIYLTGSRGAALSCAIGILVILAQATNKRLKYPAILLAAVILVALILFIGSSDNLLADQIIRGNTRDENYALALSEFLEYQYFGVPVISGRPQYVESTALAFMQLGGIFGFILVILFYKRALSLVLNSVRGYRLSKNTTLAYFTAIFSALLAASIFEAFPLNFISIGSVATAASGIFLTRAISELHLKDAWNGSAYN